MDRENVMFRYERENLEEAMSKLQEEKDKLAKQVSKLNMEKERLKNSKPVSNIKSTSFISTLKTTYEPAKFEKPLVPETNKENTSYQ
jgi:predicted  nucleic acid-binding Zn-ribbon protein